MPITDLPGYYPEILDGGLGVLPASLAGLCAVVGTAEKGSTDVRFAIDPDDVAEEYGFGSLTDHLYDAFVAGARQVGIVRARGDAVATDITTPVQKKYGDPTGGGAATVAVGKVSPHVVVGSNRRFRLKIVKGGDMDDATYKISVNNGLVWGAETRFIVTTAGPPRKAKIDVGNGTYIEFTEAGTPADSFLAGDEYRWWTYEPRATLDEIIAACEKAVAWQDPNTGYGFEYIYVPIQSSQIWGDRNQTNILALWAALITIAEDEWNDSQRTVFFMLDTPPMHPMTDSDSLEELAEWITLLTGCSAAKRSTRLSVNAGFASMLSGDGTLQIRAAGGSAAGLASKAKLHHSIGWVRYMTVPNSIQVYPFKPIHEVTAETLGTGDGSIVLFEGLLAKAPVVPWTVVITSDDTTPEEFVDGGDGILYDSTSGAAAGTIDYDSGRYSVTFATAPAVSKTVTADYEHVTKVEMDKGNLALLSDARFITLRHWIGYGIRFTDDWMMAPPTSDYYCIRNRRIIDEAVRMVGIANVPYVNSPGITEKDMAAYKADLSRPLEAMTVTDEITDQPIMAYTLTLTPDANIWSNGIVNCKVEIVPTPTKKKLVATFQLRTKIEE